MRGCKWALAVVALGFAASPAVADGRLHQQQLRDGIKGLKVETDLAKKLDQLSDALDNKRGEELQPVIWNPFSASPSSLCGGSGCTLSGCFGSWCYLSGCFGSGCFVSGCGGSGCVGSGCALSVCGTSGCFVTVCVGSATCVGSGCVTGTGCLTCMNACSETNSSLTTVAVVTPSSLRLAVRRTGTYQIRYTDGSGQTVTARIDVPVTGTIVEFGVRDCRALIGVSLEG